MITIATQAKSDCLCTYVGNDPEEIKRAVALWLIKSSELHKIPESVMNTIVGDVQDLFDFIMESLHSNITSILQKAPNIDRAQEIIAQHFHSSTYSIFKGFQTSATRRSYIKQKFDLVVSWATISILLVSCHHLH